MGINNSKPPQEADAAMLSHTRRPEAQGGSLLHHSGNLRLGKTPFEALDRRLSISATKSTNLPDGSEFADDILSKSTESTEGSPELPHEPIAADAPAVMSLARPATWFHQRPTSSRNQQIPNRYDDPLPPAGNSNHQHQQSRESGRRLKTQSCSVPLKCPARKHRSTQLSPDASHHPNHSSFNDHQEEDNDHLQHLYDMRTWDMYLRITEARRKQNVQSHSAHYPPSSMIPMQKSTALPPSHIEPSGYGHFSSTEDMDPIPIEVGGSLSGHVMIFGDLE